MKKITISIILMSMGVSLLAQGRQGGGDSRRYEDNRRDVAPVQVIQQKQSPSHSNYKPTVVHNTAPKPVTVHNTAPKHNTAPRSVVYKKAPAVVYKKPAPVVVYSNHHHHNKKIVVKRPRPSLISSIFRVVAPPPPSRAVVILTSTATTPVYEFDQLDREPQLIQYPTINYPQNMAKAGLDGEVNLLVQIDQNGYVGLEEVVSATNSDFEKEAIAALSTFKYEEPLKNGRRVNARFYLTIPFELSE